MSFPLRPTCVTMLGTRPSAIMSCLAFATCSSLENKLQQSFSFITLDIFRNEENINIQLELRGINENEVSY